MGVGADGELVAERDPIVGVLDGPVFFDELLWPDVEAVLSQERRQPFQVEPYVQKEIVTGGRPELAVGPTDAVDLEAQLRERAGRPKEP